ncbi:hypothetical protein GCM10010390_58220 [Streptomyces mordarskii]|uniref:Uncharacterized protein n=1 Tax=Streptomyces mordarskii TaxID=1226758 RepID=A0ABN1DNU9_9ACTN
MFRAPLLRCRRRLGWLLGGRMLLLTRRGRTSGLSRQAVQEVTGRDPATGAYHLASGCGPSARLGAPDAERSVHALGPLWEVTRSRASADRPPRRVRHLLP